MRIRTYALLCLGGLAVAFVMASVLSNMRGKRKPPPPPAGEIANDPSRAEGRGVGKEKT